MKIYFFVISILFIGLTINARSIDHNDNG